MDFIFKLEERILKSGKGATVVLALAFIGVCIMVAVWLLLYNFG